jgi:hypothetical protein
MAEDRIFRKTCHGIEVYVLVDGVLTRPEDLHEVVETRRKPLTGWVLDMAKNTLSLIREKVAPSQ